MGVKKLFQIVRQYAYKSITERPFSDYNGSVQAIDSSLAIYKFCIALSNTSHFRNSQGEVVAPTFACFYKSMSMLRYKIIPLWVFDGPPPLEKNETIDERRKIKVDAAKKLSQGLSQGSSYSLSNDARKRLEKRVFKVSINQMNELKNLLDLMGLSHVDSPGEAEAQCAAMNISGKCNGVVTEDWDAVLFGCKTMLKDFSNKTNVIEINVKKLMIELGVDRIQLIDLCSILGNDYCTGISNIKPLEAYARFKSVNFIMTDFINEIKKDSKFTIPSKFEEEFLIARSYYLHAPVLRPELVSVKWNEPKYGKLYEYMVNYKKFNREVIISKINELKYLYDQHKLA